MFPGCIPVLSSRPADAPCVLWECGERDPGGNGTSGTESRWRGRRLRSRGDEDGLRPADPRYLCRESQLSQDPSSVGTKRMGRGAPGQHLLKDVTQSLSRGDSSATPGPHGAHKQQSRLGVTVKRGEDSCSGTGGAALAFSCFLPAPVPETLTPRRKGWR